MGRGAQQSGMGEDPLHRYHRQMLLDPVGRAGQERLGASHALVVGCGALGCVTSELLARAGVGRITIVDRDLVELTNLQRQVLFEESDVREHAPKAVAAAQKLRRINSGIEIEGIVADAGHRNIERIAGLAGSERPAVDVILDGTDNFEARYLLNDVAVRHGIPFVYAGAVAFRGMGMTIVAGVTACLRCVFEEPAGAGTTETCDTAGVFGPAVVVSAAMQAGEGLKVLLGDSAISAALVEFDLHANTHRSLAVGGLRRADCPCCGLLDFAFLDGRRASDVVTLCGRDAYQISGGDGTIDLEAMAGRLAAHGEFAATRFLVRGELRGERGHDGLAVELTVFGDGRAVIGRAIDESQARAVYARYVGS